MGLNLSPNSVYEFDRCMKKELLSYVSYPPSDSAQRCFSYPQFLIEDNEVTLIDNAAFPDDGCLPMVMSKTNSSAMLKRYGKIVVMTVNQEANANRYYPTEPHRLNSIIDPSFSRGKSAVEFVALQVHPLSSQMIQVLEVQESIDFSRALEHPVNLFPDQALPQTKLTVVMQEQNGKKKLFGPFESTVNGETEVSLRPSNAYGLYVAGFNEESFNFFIELFDNEGDTAARFIDTAEFQQKFESSAQKYDWVTDGELLEALARVSRTGENALTKRQSRDLKSEIARCLDETAKISLTDERRQRMVALLDLREGWQALSEEAKSEAVSEADPEQLAQFVLTDSHFSSFYDKVIENDQVLRKVEEEKAQYAAEVIEAKEKAEAAKNELSSYETQLAAKKQEIIEQVTQEVDREKDNLNQVKEQVAHLNNQNAELSAANEKLKSDKILLEHQIRKTIDEMSDELSVSSKILENEMLKQIVSSINGQVEEGAAATAPQASTLLLRPDEADMSAAQVIAVLENAVVDLAGRDLTTNELINLMTCLIQGYVVTLAGMPGTGKTSLANILAGAMGLTNNAQQRFAEVSVERGWASCKDFIGYYNPLTKTMEKSNTVAFDAFSALDIEARSGAAANEVSPYVFLLDEANLSSIEHYWSPFLRACDAPRGSSFDLSLGGETSFKIPGYLRFIATVNFDHTTEELSQRFLDRSWVITLDPEDLDLENDVVAPDFYDFGNRESFSYQKLQEVFGVTPNASLSVDMRAKFKEIVDLCAKYNRPVSPRSQKMVWNYARTTAGLMDCSTAQSAYAPVDYAVAQKVLPLLSGAEDSLESLLNELERVSGLPVVKERVSHMLEVGNDSGFYQYFA